MFDNIYKEKRVLVTGNTGFKGSWLTSWLLKCGANVYGYSLNIPTNPSMYKVLGLEKNICQYYGDIRDKGHFISVFNEIRPDFVFHLAAQAIVSTSYANPFDTLTTNVIGTASVLEALRQCSWPVTAVLITSDKAYDNVEWIWGYRESDAMGGKDVYSGSKGAAELTIKSYWHSFIKHNEHVRLGVARAGNVIGGGDWSADRIVVDTMNAFAEGKAVEIRSPKATRPWQHVLEPLSGYMRLAQMLYQQKSINGEAYNFGPKAEQTKTVLQLVEDLARNCGIDPKDAVKITGSIPFEEAKLLKLNCDKSLAYLQWHSVLNYEQTVKMITDWYATYNQQPSDLFEYTLNQITVYENEARRQLMEWTND